MDKYNLSADMIQMAHAITCQPLSSTNVYKQDHIDQDVGRGHTGPDINYYPLYVKAKQADNILSQVGVIIISLKITGVFCISLLITMVEFYNLNYFRNQLRYIFYRYRYFKIL